MKSLKFDHEVARKVADGTVGMTLRLHDEKGLTVHETVQLIDKIDPERPQTWKPFGAARIDRIVETQVGTQRVAHTTEIAAANTDMGTEIDSYVYNDVSDATLIKRVYFTMLQTEQGLETENVNKTTFRLEYAHLYTDGGSRGNPGPSAAGLVVIDPSSDTVLLDKGMYLGVTTNNLAEYMALRNGLQEALQIGVGRVDCYLDSMLVVNQMKGIFHNKNRDLWPVHDAIEKLAGQFKSVTYTHVPRELNKLADTAVNRTLDSALGIYNAQSLS